MSNKTRQRPHGFNLVQNKICSSTTNNNHQVNTKSANVTETCMNTKQQCGNIRCGQRYILLTLHNDICSYTYTTFSQQHWKLTQNWLEPTKLKHNKHFTNYCPYFALNTFKICWLKLNKHCCMPLHMWFCGLPVSIHYMNGKKENGTANHCQ